MLHWSEDDVDDDEVNDDVLRCDTRLAHVEHGSDMSMCCVCVGALFAVWRLWLMPRCCCSFCLSNCIHTYTHTCGKRSELTSGHKLYTALCGCDMCNQLRHIRFKYLWHRDTQMCGVCVRVCGVHIVTKICGVVWRGRECHTSKRHTDISHIMSPTPRPLHAHTIRNSSDFGIMAAI